MHADLLRKVAVPNMQLLQLRRFFFFFFLKVPTLHSFLQNNPRLKKYGSRAYHYKPHKPYRTNGDIEVTK